MPDSGPEIDYRDVWRETFCDGPRNRLIRLAVNDPVLVVQLAESIVKGRYQMVAGRPNYAKTQLDIGCIECRVLYRMTFEIDNRDVDQAHEDIRVQMEQMGWGVPHPERPVCPRCTGQDEGFEGDCCIVAGRNGGWGEECTYEQFVEARSSGHVQQHEQDLEGQIKRKRPNKASKVKRVRKTDDSGDLLNRLLS